MKDFKIPGVVWVVLLIFIGVVLQANSLWIEQTLHVPAMVVGLVVSGIFLYAKTKFPGTEALTEAIALIEKLLAERNQRAAPAEGMRSAASSTPVVVTQVPEMPNKTMRVLFG